MKLSSCLPLLFGASVASLVDYPGLEQAKRGLLSDAREIAAGNASSCTYPSQQAIKSVWDKLEQGDDVGFISNFELNVDWTVMGTHPLAGHYDKLALFVVNGNLRLYNSLANPPTYTVVNIVGGCDEAWSVQETLLEATAKNGRKLDEIVIWATKWNTAGKVVQVRSYVDSYATAMVIHENEDWTDSTWRSNRTTYNAGPNGYNQTEIADYFGETVEALL